MACYARDRVMYNLIYDKFCEYDRDNIINLLVTTSSSYDPCFDDQENMEVVKVINLGQDFVSFFKSYKEYIKEQTEIVPYVNPKDNDCSIVQNEFKVSMDPIYPEFYTKYMINTKDISNSELERRFLEADWLTNDHFDELVMNVPTKDEMQPDNVHHSTIKCKSSS